MTLVYSKKAGVHAGVDIINRKTASVKRAGIYTHAGYFVDMGTPEALEELRKELGKLVYQPALSSPASITDAKSASTGDSSTCKKEGTSP